MMSPFKPIRLDFETQPQPYFIYSQISLGHYREYALNKIAYGYGYLLREIVLRTVKGSYSAPLTLSDDLFIEFFSDAVSKARQTLPIPFQPLCNPSIDAPVKSIGSNAVANKSYKLKSSIKLNFFYPYGDTINLQITGQNAVDISSGRKLDMVLKGYYIPEKTLDMWSK